MKKTTLFILFTLLFGSGAYATSLDSLFKIADNFSGIEKTNAYNRLAEEALAQGDLGTSAQLTRKAVRAAREQNYDLGLAQAYDLQGRGFEEKYDYTNAMKAYVNALKVRDRMTDRRLLATSKNNLGRIFYLQEDFVQAEENLTEALEIRLEEKDLNGAAESQKNLGDVYLAKKLYGKAQEYYRKALDLKLQAEDAAGATLIADKIGKISKDLGDYDSALIYFQMSLDLHSSLEDVPKIAEDFNKIALTLIEQGEYEDAMDANLRAYNIREDLDLTFGKAESAKNFGVIYAAQNNKAKAVEWLEKSALALKNVKSNPGKPEVLKAIGKTYADLGMHEKAYQFQTAFAQSRAYLFNEEKSRALLELTTKYESEFAAEEQARQINKLEGEQSAARKIRWFLLAVIGLIALFLLNLFNSYRTKKKDNELLRNKNEEIQRSRAEIAQKNEELNSINANLDLLNTKLVDEIAEREAIEKSSFARDRFLATMSHEMRTPINIIVGLTHLLLDEKPREDQIEHLRTLQFSANNLVVFINDVLDFSQIETNKLNLEKREFSPQQTFDEIRSRFTVAAKDRRLTANYNYDKKIPEKLWGDPVRFNQIITNLIGTSFSYTEGGRVDVHFELSRLADGQAVLHLRIEDNGRGIPQEELNKTLHYSPDESMEDIFDGYSTSQLGLAITKRLVELQNGQFHIESQAGVGTTFLVHLPYKIGAEKKEKKKLLTEGKLPDLSGSRILLVEDNKINQLVVAKMLKKLKVTVTTADDGLQALESFNENDYDLILMDIQMPNMDGYRATAEIRKHPNVTKRDTPIIALTASAFLTEKEKAKLFGMNDHVGKPFSPDELLEKVFALLGVKV